MYRAIKPGAEIMHPVGEILHDFTIYKVHQINFGVKVNVIKLNILNFDSIKLMKVSDIS